MSGEPPPKPAKPARLAVVASDDVSRLGTGTGTGTGTGSGSSSGAAAAASGTTRPVVPVGNAVFGHEGKHPPSSVTLSKSGMKLVTSSAPYTPSDKSQVIRVPTAQEERKDGEAYTAFTIEVALEDGTTVRVSHRFSEFADFHSDWRREYSTVNIPLPPKLVQITDEDVARRCAELEKYLRSVAEVSALVYFVAKFAGVDESALKASLRRARGVARRASGDEDVPQVASSAPAVRPAVNRPKVFNVQTSVSGAGEEAARAPASTSSSGARRNSPPPVRTHATANSPPPKPSKPKTGQHAAMPQEVVLGTENTVLALLAAFLLLSWWFMA